VPAHELLERRPIALAGTADKRAVFVALMSCAPGSRGGSTVAWHDGQRYPSRRC
jgi:hypothetical protein